MKSVSPVSFVSRLTGGVQRARAVRLRVTGMFQKPRDEQRPSRRQTPRSETEGSRPSTGRGTDSSLSSSSTGSRQVTASCPSLPINAIRNLLAIMAPLKVA